MHTEISDVVQSSPLQYTTKLRLEHHIASEKKNWETLNFSASWNTLRSGAISEQELLYQIFYMIIQHIFVNVLEQNI